MTEFNLREYIEEKREHYATLRDEAFAEAYQYTGALAELDDLEEKLDELEGETETEEEEEEVDEEKPTENVEPTPTDEKKEPCEGSCGQ